MVPNTLPDAALLREIFSYDPDTGSLKWKHRPLDHFKNLQGWKLFHSRFAGKEVAWKATNFRPQTLVNGKAYPLHRIIFKIMTGRDPAGVIDHINQDCTDNRWSNLRDANGRINRLNTKARADNKLGIKHVMERNGKYLVAVGIRGKSIHVGSYESLETARAVSEAVSLVTLTLELHANESKLRQESHINPA